MSSATLAFNQRYPLLHELATKRLKQVLAVCAASYLLLAFFRYAELIYHSEDLFTALGPIIGGDFIVFHHAAEVAGTPDMLSIYEMANLKAQLQAAYPGKGAFNFAWMYPPTMSLIVAPFAWPPYLWSFTLWVAIFAGAFFFSAARLWSDKWALFFLAASPCVFLGVITGQNGFLSATLIAVAGAFADRRPILAGVAAGLLTFKPQLGLLIPIAFAAAGCWRAFAAAAVTAVLFGAVSVGAYGVEAWTSFIDAMTTHGGRMAGYGFPFSKLVTPFGLATMLGVPAAFAGAIQLAASLALVAYVAIVWRRVKEWDLRVAALSTATMLVTPYAFYYEIVIMAPAMLLVAKRAVETGWMKFERESLIAVWILPLMMPGESGAPGLPICSVGAMLAFFIAARRVWPAARVRFASEVSPAQAGV